MPTEGQKNPNPEPDPSPSTESTPSSPNEERGSKEGGKSSVPETPSDKSSPDDPPAADAADSKTGVKISGTKVDLKYPIYHYESLSSDEDEDDMIDFDDSWIDSYSAETNPHWKAIRDACTVVVENARTAVANYEWHAKETGVQLDTKRLERLALQLTALSEDLDELATATAPQTIFPDGSDVNTLSELIRILSEMGTGEVRGRIDVESLVSIYKGFRAERKKKLPVLTASKLKVFQCLIAWETYRGAFVGYYKETKVLQRTQGIWEKVGMSEEDLMTWNVQMKAMAETANRLLWIMERIMKPLISEIGVYMDTKRELKAGLAEFLGILVQSVYREEKIVFV